MFEHIDFESALFDASAQAVTPIFWPTGVSNTGAHHGLCCFGRRWHFKAADVRASV
ncbi:hypothetical protein [Ralstonia pseudosolanacearum]|uniref:hypothetical protein n=1 Tax=Ralstonia pseudosolanacearum TaxID=1310165 RepID=UPI0030D5441B